MSLPHLLLVDDSDAVLNFEKAVLSGLYRFSIARDGVEALEKIRQLKPDGVLLDLSMPRMDGDEALRILKADPALASIPVLVVSSEKDRAEACLKAGADGMLIKPVSADDLKSRVALVLEAAQERERRKSSAFLFFRVGPFEMGIPLKPVIAVHSQPATRSHLTPQASRQEDVDFLGETIGVLDLAKALGVHHEKPLLERKLVFLGGSEKLAVCVDGVWEPEELLPEQIHAVKMKDKNGPGNAGTCVLSCVDSSRGLLPVVNPETFFSVPLTEQLSQNLKNGFEF